MTKFNIELRHEKSVCVELICLHCGNKFSTELDVNLKNHELLFQNNGVLYCTYCEESYDYTLKYDSNNLEIYFEKDDLFGGLKFSGITYFEESEKLTHEQSKKFYFLEIARLKKIVKLKPQEADVDQAIHRLVYSGVITCLETYLGEIFTQVVFHSQYTLEKFIENYEPYQKEKIFVSSIVKEFNSLEFKVRDDLYNFIYHNVSKLISIFSIYGLNLQEYKNIKGVANHIQRRHNLVHRNGLDRNDNLQEICEGDINLAISDCNSFVEYIAEKVGQKSYLPLWLISWEIDDDIPF